MSIQCDQPFGAVETPFADFPASPMVRTPRTPNDFPLYPRRFSSSSEEEFDENSVTYGSRLKLLAWVEEVCLDRFGVPLREKAYPPYLLVNTSLSEVFQSAAKIIDDFTEMTNPPLSSYQLIGVVALLLSSKYHLDFGFDAKEAVEYVAHTYDLTRVRNMELEIWRSRGFVIGRELTVVRACFDILNCIYKGEREPSLILEHNPEVFNVFELLNDLATLQRPLFTEKDEEIAAAIILESFKFFSFQYEFYVVSRWLEVNTDFDKVAEIGERLLKEIPVVSHIFSMNEKHRGALKYFVSS